jgi:hypothetical protein
MVCDTRLKPRQTIQERAKEVRDAAERLAQALVSGRVKTVIGPKGELAFTGWDATSRDGVTDACAYRTLMRTGSAMARMMIQRAEALAGRSIDKQVLAQGMHSHDGGASWHKH